MIVYKIINKVNGKIYIGSTIKNTVEERWGKRFHKKHGGLISEAINSYGYENFTSEIVEFIDNDEKLLRKREAYWMTFFNSTDPSIGYNSQDAETGKFSFESLFQRIIKLKNRENKRKRISSDSKYHGVFYDKSRDKWKYEISVKDIYLQSKNFTTQEDAAIARDIVLISEFGARAKKLLCFEENFEKYLNNEIEMPEKIRKIPQKKSLYRGVSFETKSKLWTACFAKSSKLERKIKKGMFITESEAAEVADLISIQECLGFDLNFPIEKYLDDNYQIPLSTLAKKKTTPYKGISFSKKHNRYEIIIYDNAKVVDKKVQRTLEDAVAYRKKYLSKLGISEELYDRNLASSYELDLNKIKENIKKIYLTAKSKNTHENS